MSEPSPGGGGGTAEQGSSGGGAQTGGGVTKNASQPDDHQSARRTFTLKALGAEAKAYDFKSAREDHGHKTTVVQSVGHLVKSCLGGGVVSIHASYALCGLWLAVIMNVFLGILVAYLMIVLAKSAQRIYGRAKVHTLSYPEVAEASLQICKFPKLRKYSRVLRILVDTTIMIDLFGSCCCYQCLIAEQTTQLVSHYFKVNLSIRIYIAMLLIPCIAICMILSLKYLAPFSIVADAVILIVAISTVVFGMQNAASEKRKPTDMPFWLGSVPKMFQFMGGCVFSMEGVGVTMPIENNMEDPKKITLVLVSGMVIVVSIVMTVGFFGYWGYAANVKAPVTTNFPMSMITLVLKIALPLMIYVTFALNFWVPFNLAWVYIKHRHPGMNPSRKERIYRALFVTIITAVAVTFPQVVVLMGIIGAFCLTNMGFIYPAFIELMLDWEEPGLGVMKWRLIRFILIFIFAIVLMIIGTAVGCIDLIKQFG